MNSRERVLTTLNHKEPDKVPIDLGGNQCSIHMHAYKKLLKHLNIEEKEKDFKFSDWVQHIAYPCEELLERFQVDIRYLRRPDTIISEKHFDPIIEGKYIGDYDALGVFWGNSADKNVEDILYYDPCIHPLKDMKTVQEIHEYDWPDGNDIKPFKGLHEEALRLRRTDYAIGTPTIGCIFEYCTFMFGFTTALKHLRKNPEIIIATMEELEKYWWDYARNFIEIAGKENIDFICVNGDLAEQAGPIMNPKVYSKYIKGIEHKFSRKIHEFSGLKINYHSCGSVAPLIPEFVEIGYDAVNPVQIGAYDMEPCSLKKRFGDKITFWGGLCDTQKTLPFGTIDEIQKEVEYNLKCFKPNGGYIAANIHNITAEVSPDRIVAMYDTAIENRKY